MGTVSYSGCARCYCVAGVTFSVELRSPWSFMEYGPSVAERVALAACGGDIRVSPVRAGDAEPGRSFIRSGDEVNPAGLSPNAFDFSRYEPFRAAEGAGVSFRVLVEQLPEGAALPDDKEDPPVLRECGGDSIPYSVYRRGEDVDIVFGSESCGVLGFLRREADIFTVLLPSGGKRRRLRSDVLDTSLMISYLLSSGREHILMVHSSVISHCGLANMFFGVSGTGKSTHSRLWLENVPGTELLNDDNPVIRLEDGVPYVYGTPWSGKTPCYRNVRMQVRALVFLRQAPVNRLSEMGGVEALISMLKSVSTVVWDPGFVERLNDDIAELLSSVPFRLLECLPDGEAARVCLDGIE